MSAVRTEVEIKQRQLAGQARQKCDAWLLANEDGKKWAGKWLAFHPDRDEPEVGDTRAEAMSKVKGPGCIHRVPDGSAEDNPTQSVIVLRSYDTITTTAAGRMARIKAVVQEMVARLPDAPNDRNDAKKEETEEERWVVVESGLRLLNDDSKRRARVLAEAEEEKAEKKADELQIELVLELRKTIKPRLQEICSPAKVTMIAPRKLSDGQHDVVTKAMWPAMVWKHLPYGYEVLVDDLDVAAAAIHKLGLKIPFFVDGMPIISIGTEEWFVD
jgi:hypothetical protein